MGATVLVPGVRGRGVTGEVIIGCLLVPGLSGGCAEGWERILGRGGVGLGVSCVRDTGDGTRDLGVMLDRGNTVGVLVMRKTGRDGGESLWSRRRCAMVDEGVLVVVGGPRVKRGVLWRVGGSVPLLVVRSLGASVGSDVWWDVLARETESLTESGRGSASHGRRLVDRLTEVGGELGRSVVLATGRSKAVVNDDGPRSIGDAVHRDRENRPLGGNVEPLRGMLSVGSSVARRRVLRPVVEPRLAVSGDGGGSRGGCTLCREREKPAALPLVCSGVAWGFNRALTAGIGRGGRTSCRTGAADRGGGGRVPRLFKS